MPPLFVDRSASTMEGHEGFTETNTSFLGDRLWNGSPYAIGPDVLSVCNGGILCPNGWIDPDSTWYGGRPRLRRHCVRWGPSSPHRKGHNSSPTFQPTLLWHGCPSQQLLSSCPLHVGITHWKVLHTRRRNEAEIPRRKLASRTVEL